jgi:hypothetical protein
MLLSDVFLSLGEQPFGKLVGSVSMGKLRTYQLFDRLKARAHLAKLNAETLRKAAPRLWARLTERDDEFAKDLAQAILVSNLDMIVAVLDYLGIPNDGGFFAKDEDPKQHLEEGWQQRVYEKFRGQYPEATLLFYINHLAWETGSEAGVFQPAA